MKMEQYLSGYQHIYQTAVNGWIAKLPKHLQEGAEKMNAEWSRRAQARETKLMSDLNMLKRDYNNVKDPVLVHCEIDWFESQYAEGYQLSAVDEKTFDSKKKDPAGQRVFLREKRWIHILTNHASAPEVMLLLQRMKKQSVTVPVMANGVANLFEVIANTVIYALKLGKRTEAVTIMNREPFDKCAGILINIAPEIPTCKKRTN